jgi:hypothetical protein
MAIVTVEREMKVDALTPLDALDENYTFPASVPVIFFDDCSKIGTARMFRAVGHRMVRATVTIREEFADDYMEYNDRVKEEGEFPHVLVY